MASSPKPESFVERRRHDQDAESRLRTGAPKSVPHGVFRSLGLGLITGAADDDPSAIGTYASAGAAFGPSFLWSAPVTFPMMIAVVYLSSKLGQVTGQGLAAAIRDHFPRWILYLVLIGVLAGNTIEAGADIGGISAAINILVPIPILWIVTPATLIILSLQLWGSYALIRSIFRWLALALLAYAGSAILAKPNLITTLKDTFVPTIHFNVVFLTTLVAVFGTTLSPYLYVWQADQEVEEDISMGRRRLSDRKGTTKEEIRHTAWDVSLGMLFSNVVMYFIILSTAATLFQAGQTKVSTAAQAAQALRPLAGNAAGVLFALGVIGVGFLAVPVMTTGAAYVVCQTFGWKYGLHTRPAEAKGFYLAIVIFHALALALNFIGINPIQALVWAGVVQGFLAPPLMALIMFMTNRPEIMGKWVNGRGINILGWMTTLMVLAATIGVVVSWVHS